MINWEEKFINITWEDFRNQTFELGKKISDTGAKFDVLISIARGGLSLAQLLSDTLNLPIAAFTIQSYRDLAQEQPPRIIYHLSASLTGKKILLADDISDTGKTFLRGLSYLEELGATLSDIKTCALYIKPHTQYRPHFYLHETDRWVIYPYESHETMSSLIPIWQKAGVTIGEIKTRFLKWNFPKAQVDYFVKPETNTP